MSKHKSYGKRSGTAQKRSVLTRWERINVLRKLGRWNDETAKVVTGLPKTPVISLE